MMDGDVNQLQRIHGFIVTTIRVLNGSEREWERCWDRRTLFCLKSDKKCSQKIHSADSTHNPQVIVTYNLQTEHT